MKSKKVVHASGAEGSMSRCTGLNIKWKMRRIEVTDDESQVTCKRCLGQRGRPVSTEVKVGGTD